MLHRISDTISHSLSRSLTSTRTHTYTHTHISLPVFYPRFCAGRSRPPPSRPLSSFFSSFLTVCPQMTVLVFHYVIQFCRYPFLSVFPSPCLCLSLPACLSACLPLPFFAPAFWPACGLHPPPLFFIRFSSRLSLVLAYTYIQAGRQAGMHTYTHRYIHARTHAYIPWSLDVIVDSVGVSSPRLVDSRCMHACVRACMCACLIACSLSCVIGRS